MEIMRFRFYVMLIAVVFGEAGAVWADDVGKAIASHFGSAPDGSLIRKIEWPDQPSSVIPAQAGIHGGLLLIESKPTAAGRESDPLLDLSFRIGKQRQDSAYEPLKYRNQQWYGSTFWTGPDWTRVGKDWHHPGESTPSVRCFRVPRDGRVTVTGPVFKLHQAGDGIRAMIRHGEEEIWRAEIAGADGEGVEPKLTLDVRKGDALRFIVHKRGNISCDTTHWDPVITYAAGNAFEASKSFSQKAGQDGWFYEMLVDEVQPKAPTVLAIGRDLSLREWKIDAKQPVVLTHKDLLPFIAIADGEDASGVILALDADARWSCRSALSKDGVLRVTLTGDAAEGNLPRLALGSYDGPRTASFAILKNLPLPMFASLRNEVRSAYDRLTAGLRTAPELDLFLMAQSEWRRDDKIEETVESYAKAVNDQINRSRDLLADLKVNQPEDLSAHLNKFAAVSKQTNQSLDALRGLYLHVRLLKRDIAFANPLLDFDKLLFCKRKLCRWSHLNMQYFGWRQRAGGGIFILEEPGRSMRTRSVVGDQLPPGNYLEPRLSYDGKRIVFSYVQCGDKELDAKTLVQNEKGEDNNYFHIYEINVDGAGLRQITRGPYDDVMPNYLPDGGIVFCSTRRRSYSRCFGGDYSWRWHAYTVHRMDADGGNVQPLSFNDVAEWFPTVSNTGHILFARWDYIDRDAVTHQNLWAMRPDGANQVAVWGNATPKPHCTFQAKPIPGSSKIVFIASAHHALTGGPVCILDPTVDSNSRMDVVTKITPLPFPEAEGFSLPDYYEFAWPLSEKYFLVGYSNTYLRSQGQSYDDPTPDNALGIYLLDAAGNRELIYRDPALNSTTPIPLRLRPRPPVLSSTLAANALGTGEMILTDIYQGLGDVPRGSIKELRIIQIFPKTTPWANSPRIGFAGEENARAILGTVPVEPDGSACFLAPAQKPILFQALDKDGFAYQTMRSTTAVQPGERTSCIGCHENRNTTPQGLAPMAMRRPPSQIEPGELGGRPFSFVEVVQPVLDRHCIKCHSGDKPKNDIDLTGALHKGFTKSYWSLCGGVVDWQERRKSGDIIAQDLVPRFWQRNQIQVTPPGGTYGALRSRLMTMLRKGHNDEVKLSDGDLRRLAAWIDCNAIFYGAYDPDEQAKQLAGERIEMPEIQ
ncbi:MAG: hypothetical protein AB1696_19015 [Planctomycetota bacterium]